MRESVILSIIAVVTGQQALYSPTSSTCNNPTHARFWPNWIAGTVTKLIMSPAPVDCHFNECKPLFTSRSGCNRIGVAYHPYMADTMHPDFPFRAKPAIPRREFMAEVYEPLVKTFERYNQKIVNIGALDKLTAVSKAGNLRAGDVLVYVANEYVSSLDGVCEKLRAKGVVVLPVFVGTDINLSHLTYLAESQKTGAIADEFARSANAEIRAFADRGTAGLILPGVDYSNRGNLGMRRQDAIVMFARLFAQCPGSCFSTCMKDNAFNPQSIHFPPPPNGDIGCCGPVGRPGGSGMPGAPGPKGCDGKDGQPGPPGPLGPSGRPGDCGVSGSPGESGIKGVPGDTGDNGVKGADGPCGDPGKQGRPGLPGTPGPKGYPGEPGPPGACGRHGPTGPSGPPGPPGHQGTPGTEGIGMIANGNDGFDEDRQALFKRALLEIMEDSDIVQRMYNIENQYNAFTNNVLPMKSCDCNA